MKNCIDRNQYVIWASEKNHNKISDSVRPAKCAKKLKYYELNASLKSIEIVDIFGLCYIEFTVMEKYPNAFFFYCLLFVAINFKVIAVVVDVFFCCFMEFRHTSFGDSYHKM